MEQTKSKISRRTVFVFKSIRSAKAKSSTEPTTATSMTSITVTGLAL